MIFGGKANFNLLNKIARKYKIKLICDAAQSIGSKYNGRFSGTMYEASGYSLNCHKHIQTGEGGLIITNSKYIADKCYRIRNHGENQDLNPKKLINNLGYNFRLTEIQCALAISQLRKLRKELNLDKKLLKYLIENLSNITGLNYLLEQN